MATIKAKALIPKTPDCPRRAINNSPKPTVKTNFTSNNTPWRLKSLPSVLRLIPIPEQKKSIL